MAIRSRRRWDNRGVHIWMLNHYATTPVKDGGESRHSLLAKHLSDFGWETTLIVASVSHPSGEQKLSGWRLVHREVNRDYSAYWLRVPAYQGNGFRRALGMLAFGLLSLVPGILPGVKKPDVVLGSAVHHFAALAAWALARRYRVPFVFEVRDVWPDVLIDFSKLTEKSFFTWLIRNVSKFLCGQAALVVSPLPNIANWVKDLGVESKEVLWVSNGADPSYLPETSAFPARKPFVFLYLGSFGNINALEELVLSFSEFRVKYPDLDCRLRLVGEGWKKQIVQNLVISIGMQDFVFVERGVAKQSAMSETQSAHCLVLPIKDALTHRKYGISPNKLFDYLLAGRPILFLGDDPADLVEASGAGVSAQLKDSLGVVEAMKIIASADDEKLKQWGAAGRALALQDFTFSSLAGKLAAGLGRISRD